MAALTTLNITEKNANNSLSVTVKVNVTKEGVFTTTLSKEDVDKIHSYGIKLPTNRLGNEGYFNSIALSDLESQIREVLKRCLSYKIVEEVPVIKYQLETNCVFSYDKNGNIVPNPSKKWTGNDENGKWRDGTSRLDALNTQPFGFSVYAKPFLKRVIEYGNGETKVEYGRLNTEKGTYAHWLNCVTSISYNRHKQVMEVECNECTSKLFVDMIKSICNISEQVKSFINPEQIKAIAESDDLFDKQIHKVRKFYLSRNPDKMMMLEERKAVIKERNKGLSPEYDKEYYCGTCGAKDGAEHPKTGYCFHCDTDNWISKNN